VGRGSNPEDAIQSKLAEARVARLATTDEQGHPHVIPVCFVYDGRDFYTALDAKPKRVRPQRLARVRHIQVQPSVALLVDEYGEDWQQLWYILVRGTAELLSGSEGKEQEKARRLLKAKYPQYRAGLLPDQALLIRIRPRRIISWGNL
jgi:PPOX class probable F420-dependent enzyme